MFPSACSQGLSYKYDVHAEIVRDGKLVEENKTVTLTAGEQASWPSAST